MEIRSVQVFSVWTRAFHWIMVCCIAVLFITGLYIGNPFYGGQGVEPTLAVENLMSMSYIRFVHFAAGFVLIASLILRIYGFIINKGDRLFPMPWKKQFWDGMIDVNLHYSFMRGAHRPYLRNSMARGGYTAVYGLILLEAATGLAMYGKVHPNGLLSSLFGWVNYLLIDEYVVHLVHHYAAWGIILFVITHVYMAVRADMTEKNGEISSMFTGTKFYTEEPDDIGDIR